MRERPYTTEQLAQRWQCSNQHVRDIIRKGDLVAFRVGRLIRIPAAEVERFEGGVEADERTDESSTVPPAKLPVYPPDR